MHILIVSRSIIPVTQYGGTERVIWYLGKELSKLGHQVEYLVNKGSYCDFAKVNFIDDTKTLTQQIPDNIDVVHFNFAPNDEVTKPHIITMHGNLNDQRELHLNTVFVSQNHAARFGSKSYVYNGLDWDDYQKPNLQNERTYFHFLGNAAWRVKNVQAAIKIIHQTREQKLKVLGGTRLNFNMGFRLTLSPRISFYGMVGGEKKYKLLEGSKGLIFPVRWSEPFGLAIVESLYFGCPVFGSTHGSLPELVTKDVGFLSNDTSTIANKISKGNQFSKTTCHQYAKDLFNSKIMAEQYLKKYEQVLNGDSLNKIAPQLVKIQQEKFLPFQ